MYWNTVRLADLTSTNFLLTASFVHQPHEAQRWETGHRASLLTHPSISAIVTKQQPLILPRFVSRESVTHVS